MVENHRHRRRQDHQIGPVHGFRYFGESLVNRALAESLLARLGAPGVAHNAAREARLLQSQPPRSAQQSQADNRHTPKKMFWVYIFQGMNSHPAASETSKIEI